MPTFLSRENRGAGGSPPAGQGRLRQHVPSPSILVLTFFSREIKVGRGNPRRDKAASGNTSRYSAFLC